MTHWLGITQGLPTAGWKRLCERVLLGHLDQVAVDERQDLVGLALDQNGVHRSEEQACLPKRARVMSEYVRMAAPFSNGL